MDIHFLEQSVINLGISNQVFSVGQPIVIKGLVRLYGCAGWFGFILVAKGCNGTLGSCRSKRNYIQ